MHDLTKHLSVGQTVRLDDAGYGYQIAVLAADAPGRKVIEITPESLLLEDAAAGVRTRIPSHLISAVEAPASAVQAAA